MLKTTIQFLLLTLSVSLLAGVNLEVTPTEIPRGASCAALETIKFTLDENEFRTGAEPSDFPRFVRIRLTQGVTLCETLVDFSAPATDASPAHFHLPVYLPLSLETNDESVRLNTSAEMARAVSIVRWVEGEDQIWIRISKTSDVWLLKDGEFTDPTPSSKVSFYLGQSARQSVNTHFSKWSEGNATLPMNTRQPDGWTPGVDSLEQIAPFANSALLEVNTVNSEFGSGNASSELLFDPVYIIFSPPEDYVDVYAEDSLIFGFLDLGANFRGDSLLAVARDRNCSYALISSESTQPHTAINPTILADGQTHLQFTQPHQLTLSTAGQDCLWTKNATLMLTVPADADYGFQVATDNDGMPIEVSSDSYLLVRARFGIEANGKPRQYSATTPKEAVFGVGDNPNVLSRLAILTDTTPLDDPAVIVETPTLSFTASVGMEASLDSGPINLQGSIFLATNPIFDSAPFNGGATFNYVDEIDGSNRSYQVSAHDQRAAGNETRFQLLPNFEWELATISSNQNEANLFYPYLPILQDNQNFWAGIVFSNAGATPIDSLEGYVYEADGSTWKIDFGSLGPHQMQTWLAQEQEDGLLTLRLLNGQMPDPNVPAVIPQAINAEGQAFDRRSSMFVVGRSTQDKPALRGFCLIGDLRFGDIFGYKPYQEETNPNQQQKRTQSQAKKSSNNIQYAYDTTQLERLLQKTQPK